RGLQVSGADLAGAGAAGQDHAVLGAAGRGALGLGGAALGDLSEGDLEGVAGDRAPLPAEEVQGPGDGVAVDPGEGFLDELAHRDLRLGVVLAVGGVEPLGDLAGFDALRGHRGARLLPDLLAGGLRVEAGEETVFVLLPFFVRRRLRGLRGRVGTCSHLSGTCSHLSLRRWELVPTFLFKAGNLFPALRALLLRKVGTCSRLSGDV